MPGTPIYVVQVFERRGSTLLTGARLPAPDGPAAISKAEDAADCMGGAVALCLAVDDEGRVWSATVLAISGDVPEGWAESVLDG